MLSLRIKKLVAGGGGKDASWISHSDTEISDVCLYDYVSPIFQQKVTNARGTYGV